MNTTLVMTYIRQRLASPMRLTLLGLTVVFPLGGVALSHSLTPLGGLASFYGLLFAAGAVGQDVSSGTLQLLLARPVTRPEYLVSRWLASGLAATGLMAIMLGVGTLIVLGSGEHVEPLELVRLLLEGGASAFGSAAVMVMFSSLVNGLGDVAVLITSLIFFQMATAVAAWRGWATVGRISQHLQASLTPGLSLEWLIQGMPPSWFELTAWASTVTLALAVAIIRLNRRELSYAATA